MKAFEAAALFAALAAPQSQTLPAPNGPLGCRFSQSSYSGFGANGFGIRRLKYDGLKFADADGLSRAVAKLKEEKFLPLSYEFTGNCGDQAASALERFMTKNPNALLLVAAPSGGPMAILDLDRNGYYERERDAALEGLNAGNQRKRNVSMLAALSDAPTIL